jgi:hypothetical protein
VRIVSVSRRTDIPAFYSPWLFRRLKEGYALVRNPRNAKQTRFVSLKPEDVQCFVFWTKDARPMFARLDELEALGSAFYFLWTVTPYGPEFEPGFPRKEQIVSAFRQLSGRIGPRRTIWRYDPVIVDESFPVQKHLEAFARMCASLEGATTRCVVSFVDMYRKLRGKGIREVAEEDMRTIARAFCDLAGAHGMTVQSCCEAADLRAVGCSPGGCIDAALVEELSGKPVPEKKDAGQRSLCRCAPSVDIGAYDTCPAGCSYCYATQSAAAVRANVSYHDPASPLLTGIPSPEEQALIERSRTPQQISLGLL